VHIQVSVKDVYVENHSPKELRLESLPLNDEELQSELRGRDHAQTLCDRDALPVRQESALDPARYIP
jgi:hypothetical protein